MDLGYNRIDACPNDCMLFWKENSQVLEFFHFAYTSKDITNLAHALMLKEVLNKVILPVMDKLITSISNMATANACIPMLSRTYGQMMFTCLSGSTSDGVYPAALCKLPFERLVPWPLPKINGLCP
ncbi:Adenylosuccinate lyase [Forsythia ovata]|uniref:Adenylosuccinate lyase n=1 Tax=Forsythia ovata TaxID=205694 RepID=A0ABD1W2F7_9LAMI